MKTLRPRLLLKILLAGLLSATGGRGQENSGVAGNEKVADIIKNYPGRGTLADTTPLTAPEEAVKNFRVREGMELELVLHEPAVRQPLFLSWDSRGRLWAAQYLQYQFPAGLKIVEYDNHLRARFDRVPEPPPRGTRGADTITVYEDSDGDGIYETSKDVITGLNIATSVVTGHGGIWVTNPPYLLFYPDEDGDDVPDSDPEVALSGFGIEDTHAVMNSLQWGPDGWLYGANGSTTTGKVICPATSREIAWQGQMIWRYHPETRHFEIYAEGGGNTFSLEIDAKGYVFSGTNHGNTRGMYYPQGSYGVKGWGKHGPLTNPYAFGYFPHMAHEGDKNRFPQAFCIYEGGLFPKSYEGKIIAPNSLHNVVWISEKLDDSSTFRTVDEIPLAETSDRWFRPVFAGLGPDGCVYLADWYDTRLSHVRPVDDWHKDSGRIYRIKPKDTAPAYRLGDLSLMDGGELLELLHHPNRWVRRRAVLEIGWKREHSIESELVENIRANLGQASLESLWAFSLLDRLDDDYASEWMGHPNPDIRRWVARLKGDRRRIGEDFSKVLMQRAKVEKDARVRAQMAATAKRIPAKDALPVIRELARHHEDLADKQIPLLIWWALEAHAESAREVVLAWIAEKETWELPIFREILAERLGQRYAMAGGEENLLTCARLLETAPDVNAKKRIMTGLGKAFQGLQISGLPEALSREMERNSSLAGNSGLLLGLQKNDQAAVRQAILTVGSKEADLLSRIELAGALGRTGDHSAVKVLLACLREEGQSALKRVALQSLARFSDGNIATTLLSSYESALPAEHDVRATADRVLAGRKEWALLFLEKVDQAHIKARNVAPDVVLLLRQHRDPVIDETIARHWPESLPALPEETEKEMSRIRTALASGSGDPDKGKAFYEQRCGLCHQLFGQGGVMAPDLTGYERKNLEFWLPGILAPSLEIREGFANYTLKTRDDRIVMGMMSGETPQSVTLRDLANQSTTYPREQIASLEASPVSLMPPGLLTGMSDEDLRHLFAYLMK